MVRARTYRRTSLCVGTGTGNERRRAGAGMNIERDKRWNDLQELRKIYALKDPRTPSGSLTGHGLRLERDLEVYRKDIEELNRMFALDDPRQERCFGDTTRRRPKDRG